MQGELECIGMVRVGSLPWEVSERLAQFTGNWLEFVPEQNAIIVRHVQPLGCPALSAVPCELIALIDSIPSELRASIPGGALYLRSQNGPVLRLVVERGDVRIEWPRADYSQPVPVDPEAAIKEADPSTARVTGWARFSGSAAGAGSLQEFIDGFEGLYPEGEVFTDCKQNVVSVQLKNVNVGPAGLIGKLRELAGSIDSLQAELDVDSFVADSPASDFRIEIRDGRVQAKRPSLWREPHLRP